MEMHHANLLISEESCRDFVLNTIKTNLNFISKANPDFWSFESASFGINDARVFENWAIGKPLIGEVKVALIEVNSITSEAQNALLKVLEEPPPGTFIFICMPSSGGILPTFLSRVRVMRLEGRSKTKSKSKAQEFLDSDLKERLAMIHSLSKKENKLELVELLKELEAVYYNKNFKNSRSAVNAEDMDKILEANIFASSRGSSPKILLEWLSCVL